MRSECGRVSGCQRSRNRHLAVSPIQPSWNIALVSHVEHGTIYVCGSNIFIDRKHRLPSRKPTFSHSSYAAFRPSYPPSLYNAVLTYHRGCQEVCLDLGCGYGVVARYLSKFFSKVIGTDPSEGMIEQAHSSTAQEDYPNLTFRRSSAESLEFLEDKSIDLVVAGQAAHWFDTTRLFPEMGRVVKKSGTLAFWGYKDPVFVDYP